MNEWLATHLICPRDHLSLQMEGNRLTCLNRHVYPCVDGIPVMLVEETGPTHKAFIETIATINSHMTSQPSLDVRESQVHPYVQSAIVGTCGNLYRPLLQKLQRYPIPELRLPAGNGEYFLDIGCNWGRWCISAAHKGYCPVGIDPSLDALLAARSIAGQLGIKANYVVADCRHLPFAMHSLDVVFSYSVLQHLSRADVETAVKEIGRVLKPTGCSLVQMPNTFGIRNLLLQMRHRFRDPGGFGVRYWSPTELNKLFGQYVGPTELSVDGFFSLNPQASDIELLPPQFRLVVQASEALRQLSDTFSPLRHIADSLYVSSSRASKV